jgi:hypothetical protein
MHISPAQARPTSSPKTGKVESSFKPKGYASGRCTPTTKTGYKAYNKPSTLTDSSYRGF